MNKGPLTEYVLDNWEGMVFVAAFSWSSVIVYWMIDIITVAVG